MGEGGVQELHKKHKKIVGDITPKNLFLIAPLHKPHIKKCILPIT